MRHHMTTHGVLSLQAKLSDKHTVNTWIFPGLESAERLSDFTQEVFLITITTKEKQNQFNPKAGESDVLKLEFRENLCHMSSSHEN